ncbi:hypothetical protein [Haloparvum sedimenti]|uniref:hypothetical protein n=1 Tax=Haloparvum sedimenti TaxID=1678448 RepID=UPI00071E836A|nr:hypothetical protein [Haloparvum sedimenti]
MEKPLAEFATELVELLALVLGTGALSSVGVYLEQLGIAALSAGDVVVGAWMLGMGAVLLYGGGWMLGYETLVPRAKRLLTSSAE